MKTIPPLCLVVLLWAASTLAWTKTWVDGSDTDPFVWGQYLDLAPEVYRDANQSVPAISTPVTEVVPRMSYVVKLPCIGCPFRLRERGLGYGYFEKPPRPNAMLLNFTIPAESERAQLGSQDLYPVTALREFRHVTAYQSPLYLQKETLGKMIAISMLDREFDGVGTAYATYDLNWDLTVLPTAEYGAKLLHFDLVSVEYDGTHRLSHAQQEIVQITLATAWDGKKGTIFIEKIGLIDRFEAARAEALAADWSGSSAVKHVRFRMAEWDQFGKLGTWAHFWEYLPWWLDRTVAYTVGFWLPMLALSPFFCCYRWVRRRRARAMHAAERTWKSVY